LLPLKDESATVKINNQVLMMSKREFFKHETKDEIRYVLLDKTKLVVANIDVIGLLFRKSYFVK